MIADIRWHVRERHGTDLAAVRPLEAERLKSEIRIIAGRGDGDSRQFVRMPYRESVRQYGDLITESALRFPETSR